MSCATGLKGRLKRLPVLAVVILMAVHCLRAASFTVTTTADSGPGSLRAALLTANTNGATDLIGFNLTGGGPFTVHLVSALPALTEPVTIDATSQPGYANKPLVELTGEGISSNWPALYVVASNCTIRGLAISHFNGDGIQLQGSSNRVQGNFIGTGLSGTNSLGNKGGGIRILSAGNLVGGTEATNRNVISGSNVAGIYLIDAGATGNRILGNYIGTDWTGTRRLGNAENGIVISGGSSNRIGDTSPGGRNVISGNYQSGVYVISSGGGDASGNVIQGNYIGPDVTGAQALTNTEDGITLVSTMNNLIGGTDAGAGNVISGNGGRGIYITGVLSAGNQVQGNLIGTTSGGLDRLANQAGGIQIYSAGSNVIGGTNAVARNVISGNGLSGINISLPRASGNLVQGNFIGVDITGTNALGNGLQGVVIFSSATLNLIGGDVVGAGNVISGNLQNGVFIADPGTRSNLVEGNLIGTDVSGSRRIGNYLSGVRIESAWNIVGGTNSRVRNVISGNSNNAGLYLSGVAAAHNMLQGNFIGVDVTGTNAQPNSSIGVYLNGAAFNTIGGTTAGSRNLISGNDRNGLFISGATATGNVVQGNYIGSDATGTRALPNGSALPISDSAGGIDISGAPTNLIGGSVSGTGNLISGNWRDGISIGDSGAMGNVIQGNFIGTQADGISPLGNEWHGIELRISGGAGDTLIGGTNGEAFNRIAYARLSGRDGIRIQTAPGNTNVVILGNSLFGNAGLGIDLGVDGVSTNDVNDSDAIQNFPILTRVWSGAEATLIQGTLHSVANNTYDVQFYENVAADPSGYGEGETFLGSTNVTTDGGGNANFSFWLPFPVAIGHYISATATAESGTRTTSEFSACLAAVEFVDARLEVQSSTPGSGASAPRELTFSWPTNGPEYRLQESASLVPPVEWTDVVNAPAETNGVRTVSVLATNANGFYRLILATP